MTFEYFAPVLHVIGYLAACAIYGMLLVMVWRAGWSKATRLPFAAGALGLVWNLGSLADTLQNLGFPDVPEYVDALTHTALAFLPAVVVHSILREQPGRTARFLIGAAYAISGAAGIANFVSVALNGFAPLPEVAHGLGPVYGILIIPLVFVTGGQGTWSRALWMFALAVFAITGNQIAYHTSNSLLLDLIGHHASMPLAFVILYQEYRFALADRFLKSALAIIALVSIAMGGYWLVIARLGDSLRESAVIVGVLALWIATALVYPGLRRAISWLVDRWLLGRDSYGLLREAVAEAIESAQTSSEVLNRVGEQLARSLNAGRVRWAPLRGEAIELEEVLADIGGSAREAITRALEASGAPELVWLTHRGAGAAVLVPTAEPPRYLWTIAKLSEGRRLGSEDAAFLEWVALRAARRIDRLRTVHERYEHELREQEMGKLTTEAELKALRAQINPHFLFNVLTTIGHLIQEAPERAMDTLLNLTELLRRVLRSTEEWTSLGEELDLVVAYLDIERARFEERLETEIQVPAELRATQVPPLILQPLVENAIKHGIAPLREGGRVTVSGELAGGVLHLRVEDTGQGASESAFANGRRVGVGLNNVEERLKGYYGDDASLATESRPGSGTAVELRLPVYKDGRPGRRSETVASSQ